MRGGKRQNLTGKVFGRLTALEPVATARGIPAWNCRCLCGQNAVVVTSQLNSGKTRSCGCLQKARASEANKTHGKSKSALFRVWCHMRKRCYNHTCRDYPDYGGRGILVCDAWHDFETFAKDMGERPSPSHSIDRIDNNKNYGPDNCKWSTLTEQARNKRTSRLLTAFGETKTLSAWAADSRCSISAQSLRSRLRVGWVPERAVIEKKAA